VNGAGEVVGEVGLSPDDYAGWVNWVNPLTGELMGIPRMSGEGRQGSPRFAEMTINAPKSLSIAAVLHEDVSDALDAAQADAVTEIRRFLGQHSVTRVGPRGKQEIVRVEQLETVAVIHRTSRFGDPHRHVHFQVGTRVWAAGKWRGLDTAALFKQQGAIRALGTAVLAAHPQLVAVLDAHGLTLDPVTGEVRELERFNTVMSKRAGQVRANLDRMLAEWDAAHPGVDPGPVARVKLVAAAWDHQRPAKRPDTLAHESGWLAELQAAGYTPGVAARVAQPAVFAVDDLSVQEIASRALDRCAAAASTWTVHTIREHVTRLITEHGVRATHEELREFIEAGTRLALDDCLSVLPPDVVAPEHVAHWTSLTVVRVETELRDLLTARVTSDLEQTVAQLVAGLAAERGLDVQQEAAAAGVASADPLVIVEGAAGAGKTTMLSVAVAAFEHLGRPARVLAPTKKAADVAAEELGIPADSVAKLVHANGWRWNRDGVWIRLAVGQADPDTGIVFDGPPAEMALASGERVVVDEAGMLDQDTALALLTVTAEARATVALVGDRAQLPAVGRGGVLDMAALLNGQTYDMATAHRFTDPEYADLSVKMRAGTNPALLFDRLTELGLIQVHGSKDDAHTAVTILRADAPGSAAVTVATNDEATALNERIRARRVEAGLVDDARTVTGMDGLPVGKGDLIQTRKNDAELRVANRQTWTVQHVEQDGTVWASEAGRGPGSGKGARKRQHTIKLPASYVRQHAHLAYAATAYGVQGTTVNTAHTVLSGGLDAAGVYVGMTRGRHQNVLHIVASSEDEAREQFVTALDRDRADRGLDAAIGQARAAVAGLVEDGPVKTVNAEKARLAKVIEQAEANAARWQHGADVLAHQQREHRAARAEQQAVGETADARLTQVRAETLTPLLTQALADGQETETAREAMSAATDAVGRASRFGRRGAGRAADASRDAYGEVASRVRRAWGSTPTPGANNRTWAEQVATQAAEATPSVAQARADAETARNTLRDLTTRQEQERDGFRVGVYGAQAQFGTPRVTAAQHAQDWRQQAEHARGELARIEAMPDPDAARYVEQRNTERAQADARREAEQAQQAERAAALRRASQWAARRRPEPPDRRGPSLGM